MTAAPSIRRGGVGRASSQKGSPSAAISARPTPPPAVPCYYGPPCGLTVVHTGDGWQHQDKNGRLIGRSRWTPGIGRRVVHSARPDPYALMDLGPA